VDPDKDPGFNAQGGILTMNFWVYADSKICASPAVSAASSAATCAWPMVQPSVL
jgi:hypothetical protein